MVRPTVAIAVAAVAVAVVSSPAAARDHLAPARLYAAGQRPEALAAVTNATDADRVDEMEALVALVRDGEPPAGALARAALMLHTDRALADRAQAPVVEAARRCGLTDDDRFARELAALVVTRRDSAPFVRRWFLAMGRRSLWDLCLPDAQAFASDGLRWFPGDANLLLVRGTAHETAGSVGLTVNTARLDGPRFVGVPEAGFREKLDQAGDALLQALAAQPEMHEARLRLGRTLSRRDRLADARTALERVIGSAREPEILYLAQLFLARVHDDAGRPLDAERAYRAALTVDPAGQAPAMGLGQLLVRSGRAPEARPLLAAALAATPRAEPRDAFMSYHVGLRHEPAAMIDALRAEVRP
jgi:tetratricopeptide (TPR) repeat protein